MTLRRGFALDAGEKVLVVEERGDFTGGSTRETMDGARGARWRSARARWSIAAAASRGLDAVSRAVADGRRRINLMRVRSASKAFPS